MTTTKMRQLIKIVDTFADGWPVEVRDEIADRLALVSDNDPSLKTALRRIEEYQAKGKLKPGAGAVFVIVMDSTDPFRSFPQ